MTDRGILYVAAFLRSLATGMVGVLLGIYLAKLGLQAAAIGLVVGAGLAAAALANLAAMALADRVGRRRFLVALSVLSGVGGAAAAVASTLAGLIPAAVVGMLNGMGRDRGGALVIEQAILPSTTTDRERTRAFAWYNVLQDAGHALGCLIAALPALLRSTASIEEIPAFRLSLGLYALLALSPIPLYLSLSRSASDPPIEPRAPLAAGSRRILIKISSLFALDSLGGGFLTTALLSYFFYERFGVSEASVGLLFFGARVANAISHLAAAWLARRFGLVNTMVFTHIPSSLLLVTVGFAPSYTIAAILFLLREGLVEMDVPTRQSYVMAVVQPSERTFASGLTHLVRLSAWAIAPALAGLFMQDVSLMMPLLIGAGMKIAYDVMLYLAFRGIRPPEEESGEPARRG